MDKNVVLAGPGAVTVSAIAAVSTLLAVCVLGGVTTLFQSRGLPMEELARAERACAAHVYVSERQSCMLERVAAAHAAQIARK